MSKARNMADLLDSNGDVVTGALDNVPPSNDASALTTGTLPVDRVPYVGRRNLIINGAMQVAQRGTSVTGLTNGSNGYHTLDRWLWAESGTSTYVMTMSQSTDAPDGFNKSLKLETTTANASLASTDLLRLITYLELQDVSQLGFGTSNAKALNLSFWVKSNKTGTYTARIQTYNTSSNAHTVGKYTINSADTWEYKTISIDANTAYSLSGFDDNSYGIHLSFQLLGGSNYTGGTELNGSWSSAASNEYCAGQTVNIADSTSNYWQITGVQLEVGSVATPFEHRSYGEELALCQRYYYKWVAESGISTNVCVGMRYSNGNAYGSFNLPATMRTIPTCSAPNDFQELYPATAVTKTLYVEGDNKNTLGCFWSSSASTGQATLMRGLNPSSYFDADAEL